MYPLRGITVVECGVAIAGPLTARYLAHFGAEVIKIESRAANVLATGGPAWAPPDLGPAGADLAAPRNLFDAEKRSLALNLKAADGRRILAELIAKTDVFVTNFSVPAIESLGLRYDDLRAWNNALIYLTMPGFGESPGPYREYRSWGPNLSALSGIDSLTGDPDRPPVLSPAPLPDYGAAYHALTAVLACLIDRRRTGRGTRVEVSQFEATVSILGPYLIEAQLTGRAPARSGNRLDGVAPRGVFPCRGDDRWVAIEVRSDVEWQALCGLDGIPEALRAGKFRSYPGRAAEQDAIEAALANWTRSQTNDEVAIRLQGAGVAAAPVQDGWDQLTDPQLEARDMWKLVAHDRMGTDLIMGLPLRFSGGPLRFDHAGPSIGHDTAGVLTQTLGKSAAELERLEAAGVVQQELPFPERLRDGRLERPSRHVAWSLLRVPDHMHEASEADSPPRETAPPAALNACRVLDLSDALSANGTRLLASLGAEVIRIDSPGASDIGGSAPFYRGKSLLQTYMDAGKQQRACNLETAAGRHDFEELVRSADVVYESTPPGWLNERGLGWQRLHELNPNLVMVSVTPFGQTGPCRNWRAGELGLWARSGLLRLSGYPDRRPVTTGASLGGAFIGAVGAVAALAALYARTTTGGQWVDVSGHEVLTTTAGSPLNQLDDMAVRRRSGVRALGSAPWGYFQCSDRPVCLLALFPDHWTALAGWIVEKTGDREALEERFQGSSQQRYLHVDDVERLINSLTALYPADEFCRDAQARGVPAAPVSSASDVLDDPHLAAIGYWRDGDLPELGRVRLPGLPFRIGELART